MASAGNVGTWSRDSLGPMLLSRTGIPVDIAQALQGVSLIGIYFSAHWCPPCRQFTPKLAEAVLSLDPKLAGSFAIVFVSGDRDLASFESYFAEMPWLAVPFLDARRRQQLGAAFAVQGIPSLHIVDATSGRQLVSSGVEEIRSADFDIGGCIRRWELELPGPRAEVMPTHEPALDDPDPDPVLGLVVRNPITGSAHRIAARRSDSVGELKLRAMKLLGYDDPTLPRSKFCLFFVGHHAEDKLDEEKLLADYPIGEGTELQIWVS